MGHCSGVRHQNPQWTRKQLTHLHHVPCEAQLGGPVQAGKAKITSSSFQQSQDVLGLRTASGEEQGVHVTPRSALWCVEILTFSNLTS